MSRTNHQMPLQQAVFFAPRFLASHAGKEILRNPITAIVELIANSWDAGATRVNINWPENSSTEPFTIMDNGHGMSEDMFKRCWLTLLYDHLAEHGQYVRFPQGLTLPQRIAFGRNGKGRFAGFCFGDSYVVKTWCNGIEIAYNVSYTQTMPIEIDKINEIVRQGHGTEIIVKNPHMPQISADTIRKEVSLRFLVDPNFEVYISGEKVSFNDIPQQNTNCIQVQIENVGEIEIFIIDSRVTDHTSKQHGVAWHVNRRLVGTCSWRDTKHLFLLDRRRISAKRYTFIVFADCLADVVLPDWSGFDEQDTRFKRSCKQVNKKIYEYILSSSVEQRSETTQLIRQKLYSNFKHMSLISR